MTGEYRELTADELTERWQPEPLADRPTVRSRYEGPAGAIVELSHPQMVPPPVIQMHDDQLGGPVQFFYRGKV